MSDHEATNYEEVTLIGPYDYLVNGTNVIAVHALQTTTTSSDFSIDVSVSMSSQEPVVVPALGTSKYEINAVWESDELTDPGDLDIQIPASVVKTGRTYRVRSRMKDNTGRWSHWSEPIEFVAGEAIGADILNYLRVSELMYNPAAGELHAQTARTGLVRGRLVQSQQERRKLCRPVTENMDNNR